MSDDSVTQYSSIIEKFNTINDSLTLFKMEISTLQKLVKNVEKDQITIKCFMTYLCL